MKLIDDLVPPEGPEVFLMLIVSFRTKSHLVFQRNYGMEALARGTLNTPLRRPEDLFRAATRAGLETALDLKCLARALWLLHRVNPERKLFINVRAETLLTDDFRSLILQGAPVCWRDKLVLEINGGNRIPLQQLRKRIEWLRRLKIAVAIDDVGAQGISLEELEAIGKVDYLKIHRNVLMRNWQRDPEGTLSWFDAAAQVGKRMKAQLAVKGVETVDHEVLTQLSKRNIHLGQGYRFGEPIAVLGPSTVIQARKNRRVG